MNFKRITSAQNPALKEMLKCRTKKGAQNAGVFIAEGLRALEEVLKSDWELQSLWFEESQLKRFLVARKELALQLSSETTIYAMPEKLFAKIAATDSPQGILAVVERRQYRLNEVLEGLPRSPLLVVLENLQDPGNVGTILRTADSAGADAVLYTKGTADVYSDKVVRSAMGSLLHLPVCPIASVAEAEAALAAKGVRLLAAHLKGACYHFEQDMTAPTAILIGNEGAGLSEAAAQAADALVKIPMLGQAESLNAGIAAGVLLYEAVRQRMK